ncbi:MAG: carboxypeptidase-like regulatory domain-containing protein [Terracidiphilus sp.]
MHSFRNLERRRSFRGQWLAAACTAFAFLVCGWTKATAQETAPPSATIPKPAAAGAASLYGTIVGPDGGLLAGAAVSLSGTASRSATSTSGGQFSFTGLPAGTYRLIASARGFKTVDLNRIVLQAHTVRFLPQIVLWVTASATVRVVAPSEQLAEKQLQFQMHQHVLGVLPNYFTSYNWNAVHLWPKQKFQLAFRAEIDPITFVVIAGEAGVEQWFNRFPEYGSGLDGYGKRYAAAYTDQFVGTMIGDALLPSIFHQDPRYFYKGNGSFGSRALYAVSRTFVCRGDSQRSEFDYSRVLGDFASGGISNLYHPAADRGASLVFINGAIDLGANAATNLIREFILPDLTSHVSNRAKKSALHLF